MKQILKPNEVPDVWNAESLYAKAERYVQKMTSENVNSWEHALWSSLSLELLARAALANVSPALIAESRKDWKHLYSALGFTPKTPRYSPRSLATNEVLTRLGDIFDTFNTDQREFCVVHTGRRNAELHSGENAFEGVSSSDWQSQFYSACFVLLETMGFSLEAYFGTEGAKVGKKLMAVAEDKNAKAVLGDLAAHEKVWKLKSDDEREDLTAASKAWATKHDGHRVVCPACKSTALVQGEAVSTPTKEIVDHEITETQFLLPNQFECVACGMKIAGLSKLTAIGLADQFKRTTVYDAAEFYAPQDDWPEYEEDNNEY